MRPDETPVLGRLRATRRDQNQTNFATAAAIIRGRGQTIIVPGEPIYWFSKNHTRNCMRPAPDLKNVNNFNKKHFQEC
jgi:hypothetical protein